MEKLLRGIKQFRSQIAAPERARYQLLANGQTPLALMITCSDSRIDPNLMTQTDLGELFVLRNAGNIVPPYGAANGGEAPTIEFALSGLGVRDIIVCGHSHCGAMNGLLSPSALQGMPAVAAWLGHAASAARIVEENHAELPDDARLEVLIRENVLTQIENLRTHPSVAARLARHDLALHAWVYRIETGEVQTYRPETREFAAVGADTVATPIGRVI